jgi:hypothetical protein
MIALSLDESQQRILDDEVSRVAAAKAGLRTRVVVFFGKIDMETSELLQRGSTHLHGRVRDQGIRARHADP